MHLAADLELLGLILAANGSPVLAKRFLGKRWAIPLDGGARFVDGRPLFGPSKTIRGIVLGTCLPAVCAVLLGIDWTIGATAGLAAMAGDVTSSFTKRRLGRDSSSQAFGLDQIPESLFPALACRAPLGLDLWDVALVVVSFLAGEIVLSRLLYKAHIRQHPY
jgi:hypothetical protein